MDKMPRRRKISLFFIIVLAVILLPTVLFIFVSMRVASIGLPKELADPPTKRLQSVLPPSFTLPAARSPVDLTTYAAPPPPPPNQSSPAGRIWLELVQENKAMLIAGLTAFDGEIYKIFNIYSFRYLTTLKVVPTTPTQAAWLQSKIPLIRNLIRLSESGDLNIWDEADRQRLQGPEKSLFTGATQFSGSFLFLLCQHALWRRQEHDYLGAGRSLMAALRLSDMFERNNVTGFQAMKAYLNEAILDPAWPTEQFRPLLDELARIEERRFPRNGYTELYTNVYLSERARLVAAMGQPTWKSPLYGYDLDKNVNKYWGPLELGSKAVTDWEVPHPLRMFGTALSAIRNKARAAAALRQYDEDWMRLIAAIGEPYPEWRTERNRLWADVEKQGNFLFSADMEGSTDFFHYHSDRTTSERMRQAENHVIRIGLMWRLDAKGTLAQRGENFRDNPYYPWRDPFTEKPLQIDSATSPTLIYSIGPDMIDQHGAKAVNTNLLPGIGNAGDIVIHLTRLP